MVTIAAQRPQRGRGWRAGFAGVLCAVMATGTIYGYAFGALAPFLIDDLQISRSQFGFLTSGFYVVGGLGSILAGRVVDHYGGRTMTLVALVLAACASLALALAPGYGWLLAGAALAGVPLAMGNPLTNRLVATHLPEGRRGVVMGLKQSGVQMGAFAAGAVLPLLALTLGWRPAMALTGVAALVAIGFAVVFIPSSEPGPAGGAGPLQAGQLPPSVWWLTAYAFLMGCGVATLSSYLVLYASEGVGLTRTAAGLAVSLLGATGIVARVAWGWGTERMLAAADGLPDFSLSLGLLSAGAVLAAIGLLVAGDGVDWLLWPSAVLMGATAISWNSVGMLAVVSEARHGAAGRASGYVVLGFYLGFVGSPIAFGYSVDVTGGYAAGWGGVATVFAAATLVVVVWNRVRRAALRQVPAGASRG